MNSTSNTAMDEKLQSWIQARMDEAVMELTSRGLYQGATVEAKPAWVLPYTLLIGKIREQGGASGHDWFICGDCPTDYAPSKVAASPRDAARHFAMQWQLDAARREQGHPAQPGRPVIEKPEEVVRRAEALSELTLSPDLWAS